MCSSFKCLVFERVDFEVIESCLNCIRELVYSRLKILNSDNGSEQLLTMVVQQIRSMDGYVITDTSENFLKLLAGYSSKGKV